MANRPRFFPFNRLRFLAGDPRRVERAAAILGRTIAAAALLLIAATWPLWTPQTVFPRVPFVGALRFSPAWLEWAACISAVTALAIVVIAGSRRRLGRWVNGFAIGALVFLVLADQHRLQPWAYQLAVLALIVSVAVPGEAISLARLVVISIYFYSALSKIDETFLASGGGPIVAGLFDFLKLDAANISPRLRWFLAGSLPAAELLVAAGLCVGRFRKAAAWASVGMHLVLLAALGPWGAGHQPGVLLWNAYFAVQNLVLFVLAGSRGPDFPGPGGPDRQSPGGADILVCPSGTPFATRTLAAFVALFPLTAPFGICDVWPAWAVYATGPERLRVYVDETDRDRLPPAVQRYIEAPRFRDGRCLVRIDRWSLDATRAPLYPENRFRLGVAWSLAEGGGITERLHIELDGPANRWTGRRTSRSLTGREAIAAEANRFWLNALPTPNDYRND